MQPGDFVEVASHVQRLPSCSVEMRARTAVGRAYYGVYLECCDLISHFPEVESPGNDHGKVPSRLHELRHLMKDEQFSKLAIMVDTLCTARRNADYRWPPKEPFLSNFQRDQYIVDTVDDAGKALRLIDDIRRAYLPRP